MNSWTVITVVYSVTIETENIPLTQIKIARCTANS